MPAARRLKCRFCDRSAPAWSQRPGERPVSGMSRLMEHVAGEHEAESEAISALAEATSRPVPEGER